MEGMGEEQVRKEDAMRQQGREKEGMGEWEEVIKQKNNGRRREGEDLYRKRETDLGRKMK